MKLTKQSQIRIRKPKTIFNGRLNIHNGLVFFLTKENKSNYVWELQLSKNELNTLIKNITK